MKVETYLKYFDITPKELSERQVAPNMKLWTDMGLSGQAKYDLLQQYIRTMDKDHYEKETFIQLLLLKHHVYNEKPFDDVCYILEVIKEYFKTKQLGKKEHLVTAYDLEYMFKKASTDTRSSLICNQITDSLPYENNSSNCGCAIAPNFIDKLFYLRKRLPGTDKHFKHIDNHIFYFIEEILHQVIMMELPNEECVKFLIDSVIGHERQHIAMGNCCSQYKYIDKHWDDKFIIVGESDIREQICNKAGYEYAMKCYDLRMEEKRTNFY